MISGVLPVLGTAIGALTDRRLDVIGEMVLAGILVATTVRLTSHDARLYLLEGSVPSVVFALGLSGWTLTYGEHEKKKAERLAAPRESTGQPDPGR